MGKIKKVRFLMKQSFKGNKVSSQVIWGKFKPSAAQMFAELRRRLKSVEDKSIKEMLSKDRQVTVTVKDEETGEEWVIRQVRLLKQGLDRLS